MTLKYAIRILVYSTRQQNTCIGINAESVAVAAADERRELRVPRATQRADQVVEEAERHGRRAVPEHALLLRSSTVEHSTPNMQWNVSSSRSMFGLH